MNWPHLRARLKEAVLVLPHFAKNPVQGMRQLPDWDWPTMLVLQGAFAAICAVLSNLIERDIIGAITGVIISPIAALLITAVFAGFFYYTFLFFFKREIPYRQIYLVLVFAAIPSQVTVVVASLIPPIVLIGVLGSMLLLFVGFTENFHLERLKTRNLLIGMTVIYLAFWGLQLFNYTSKHERMRLKATPESLDILEKELKFEE